MENEIQAKAVSQSQTNLTELMVPSYSNFGGKVHGGILLSLMDKVAYICATRHSSAYCVTVAMDDVEFRQPVDVGDLVSMMASVNYVGTTSMVIGIKVTAENVVKGIVKHTNTSYVTMVAKNAEGEPQTVPPLQLETGDDVRRFMEAIKRREMNAAFRQNWDLTARTFNIEEAAQQLSSYRCRIDLR